MLPAPSERPVQTAPCKRTRRGNPPRSRMRKSYGAICCSTDWTELAAGALSRRTCAGRNFNQLWPDDAGGHTLPGIADLHADQLSRRAGFQSLSGRGDADAVFAAGWDERALHDAVSVCALFCFMNRFVEGMGLQGSPDQARAAADRLASEAGYAGLRARLG